MQSNEISPLSQKFTPKQIKMLKALRIMARVAQRIIEKEKQQAS